MFNLRRPSFFNIFSASTSAERLTIPVKFIKQMGGRTSGSASLVGPSGNTWPVELIQQNDALFFNQGWPTFVREHFIECGDLLVFRYDGELHFTVQVFDQSACEKEAAFNLDCIQDSRKFDNSIRHKREREELAVRSEKVFEKVLKKIKDISNEFESECIDKDQEANSCEETVQYGSLSNNFALPSQSTACNAKSEHEEKKVAQSFNSSFPYFVRIMKRFNISGSYTLNIPYQFSMAHLPNCKTEIVLRNLKEASWTVNSVPTTKVHTSHTFCGGWLAFVRSNEIKMGDICIFELLRKCEFRVHILRVGKEDPQVQSGKLALSGSNVGSAATYKKTEGLLKKGKNSLKLHSKCMKKVQLCNLNESKNCDIRKHTGATRNPAIAAPCSQSKIGNERPETSILSGNDVEAEMCSQAKCNLRMLMALDEEKAARSFTSKVPHFVRIMRRFNISGSYTLKIPYKFSMAHLPDCKTEIVLRNLKGECWRVNSVPDSKGRMVHTFCGGWMAFVRGNDIKIWVKVMTIDSPPANCLHFADLTQADENEIPSVKIKPDDVVALPYSSGTTGLPKGVMLTHKGLVTSVAQQVDGENPNLYFHKDDVILCVLPLFHIYSLNSVLLCALRVGASILIMQKFEIIKLMEFVEKYKVTIAPFVPPIVLAVAKSPDVDRYDLSSIRMVMSGAAPMGKELEDTVRAKLPNAKLGQGYGMTEAGPVLSMCLAFAKEPFEIKSGACGTVVRNAEMKIVDPDTCFSLPQNQSGEICIRGAQIMKGYLNDPEATESTIDKEGWLHTGDIGYIDDDDELFIVDRLKELIKYKGFQVAPAELEAMLIAHPNISDAAVVPMKDEAAGEVPVAFVVRSNGSKITEDEIKQHISQQVVFYKRISRVFFTDSIPKAPSGKILRKDLRAKLATGVPN